MSVDEQIEELNYELGRADRVYINLEKNFERKKKFDLLSDEEESDFKDDLRKLGNNVSSLKRQIASLESQKERQKAINKD